MGRNPLSPSMGIYRTTFYPAGLKDNHTQGSCLHSTDARSFLVPLLSKIVDITVPKGCEGPLINWCSSVCFSFLQHVSDTHLDQQNLKAEQSLQPPSKGRKVSIPKSWSRQKNRVDFIWYQVTGHLKKGLFLGTSCLPKIQFALDLTLM